MNKVILLVVCIFIFNSSNLIAENRFIDNADSLILKADYYRESDREKNISYLNKAFELYKSENNKLGLANTYNRLSRWFSDENQMDTALNLALDALKYADKLQDSLLQSEIYLNLGNIYIDLKNDKISKKYYLDAIAYGNDFIKASATANIGLIYSNNNIEDTAFIYFNNANRIFLSINDSSSRILSNIAVTNMNMGTIALSNGDYGNAKKYFNKSLRTSYSINDFHNIILNYLNFSHLFVEEKNYKLAEEVAFRAYNIADSMKYGTLYSYALGSLGNIYYAKGDFEKAYDYLSQFMNTKDSLQGIDIENKIANLQMKYEVEKQQQQIRSLENEQKLNAYRIYITALIILFLASVIIYYLNKRRIKNRERMSLAEKKRFETQKKLERAKDDIIHFTKLVQENNERIECFEKELLNTNKEDSEELQKKQEKLRGMKILKDEDWVYYKTLFKDVYEIFYNKVMAIPNMTEGDRRQILLLKLGYTNKMSADVLGISTEGIKRARQRLAKKLDLKDAGKLEDYFSKI